MRLIMKLIFLSFGYISSGQNLIIPLELEVQKKYYSNADSFEFYSKNVIAIYDSLKNYEGVSRSLQNVAFALEEQKGDYSRAFVYAQAACNVYSQKKDLLQMANMHKYMGHLLGNLGLYGNGISQIQLAIKEYKLSKFVDGEVVCYFDLGVLYCQMNKWKEGYEEFSKCKRYWQKANNQTRLFLVNMAWLENGSDAIYSKDKTISECEKIRASNDIPEQMIIRYKKLISVNAPIHK